MEYDVTITEIGTKSFIINAKDEKECVKKAKQGYNSGVYTLDYENIKEVKIKIEK